MTPHDHQNRKIRQSAISWILEEDIQGSLENYSENRLQAMQRWTLKEVLKILQAEWYIHLWTKDKKSHYQTPQRRLSLDEDPQLRDFLLEFEPKLTSFTDWHRYLGAKANSPFFAINENQKQQLLRESYAQLNNRSIQFFEGLKLSDLFQIYNQLQEVWEHQSFKRIETFCAQQASSQELIKLMKQGYLDIKQCFQKRLEISAVSVDLESDGQRIFQLGWATESGTHLEYFQPNSQDNSDVEIKIQSHLLEIRTLLHKVGASDNPGWLVGHNILAWDLPILEQLNSDFASGIPVWDTLLMSWILTPWNSRHALLTSERAHQADADAVAALKLFQEQVKCLTLSDRDYCHWLEQPQDPIDYLYEHPEVLEKQIFPSMPNEYRRTGDFVIPEWRQWREWAWRVGVVHRGSPSLSAVKLGRLVEAHPERRDLRAVAVVVRQAERQQVQVVLRMIPMWLREGLDSLLYEAIDNPITAGESGDGVIGAIAYHDLPINLPIPEDIIPLYPEEGIFERIHLEPLSTEKVRQGLGSLISQTSDLAGRMLFNIPEGVDLFQWGVDKKPLHCWLEYDPLRGRQERQFPWALRLLGADLADLFEKIQQSEDVTPHNYSSQWEVILPRWKDPGGIREGLSPGSGNRLRYWDDLLLRVLSVHYQTDPDVMLLLLVDEAGEARAIEQAIATLGLTIERSGGSILRHFEKVRRRSKPLVISAIDQVDRFLDAAATLGCKVLPLIEALPLEEWWLLDQAQQENDPDLILNEAEDGYEGDGANLDEDEELQSERQGGGDRTTLLPVQISASAMTIAIERHLGPWLWTRFQFKDPSCVPIILDSRLSHLSLGQEKRILIREIPLAKLKQPERLLETLRNILGDIERRDPPTDYESYRQFLQAHWGYLDFREGTQKPAIEAIITRTQDVLVRLPTGEGKSVLFHIPALLRGAFTQRLTLVISPLRALMADQVNTLWRKGFIQSVDYLSGDRDPWQTSEVYQGIIDNRIKLLFVAPERFRIPRFREAIQRRFEFDQGFEYIVIDEAHCVSQWGFEFRPDYLFATREIRHFYRHQPNGELIPVLLFSATITEIVRKDLEQEIDANQNTYVLRPEKIRHPIQPFIQLTAENVEVTFSAQSESLSPRLGYVENIIRSADLSRSSVIIFVTRRRHAEELVKLINEREEIDCQVDYFHAGLSADLRIELYHSFLDHEIKVLVCTKAFGMGMDIAHIHWCLHLSPPNYLEDYLQEVGRIGRNKESREAASLEYVQGKLLFAPGDFDTTQSLIQLNRITVPQLRELWIEIVAEARPLIQGENPIAIIPIDEFGSFKEDALRRYLFWLEYSERLTICAYLPGLLKVELKADNLKQYSQGSDLTATVARALLSLFESNSFTISGVPVPEIDFANSDISIPEFSTALTKIDPSENQKDSRSLASSISQVIMNVAKGVLGFFFGQSLADQRSTSLPISQLTGIQTTITSSSREPIDLGTESNDERTTNDKWTTVDLSLDNLWRHSQLRQMDQVWTGILKLSQVGALKINRKIQFKKGHYHDMQEQQFKWLRKILNIVNQKAKQPRLYWDDLISDLSADLQQESMTATWSERKIKDAQKRVVRSVVKLLRDILIRFDENISDNQTIFYSYHLTPKWIEKAKLILEISQALLTILNKEPANQNEIDLTLDELLKCCPKAVKIKPLQSAIKLISNLGIYSASNEITTFSYILEILKPDQIETDREQMHPLDQKMIKTIDDLNNMALRRAQAMELYAYLPDSLRAGYIDRYFEADSLTALEKVIDSTIGEIDDDILEVNPALKQIQGRVREEAIHQAKECLNPQQKDVCEHPYNQNLLVNAGPGAGKTHVLMMRCADLIYRQGLQPHEILVLAFNRAVVYEIKKRVRDLFKQLGYGSFVRRMQVYTFHSFALKSLSDVRDRNNDLKVTLHNFALAMQTDEALRNRVSANYKAILVDEFQDMNEDFYKVILALYQGSGAGVVVIGDDDQDILLWTRKRGDRLHANQYLQDFRIDYQSDVINLLVNYRSTFDIIQRSQVLATNLIPNRVKANITLQAYRDENGIIDHQIIEDVDPKCPRLVNLAQEVMAYNCVNIEHPKSMAVLCRTNSEVFQFYNLLQNSNVKPLRIQSNNNLKLAQVREIGEWIDLCQTYLSQEPDPGLTSSIWDELLEQYRQLVLADVNYGIESIEQLRSLTFVEYESYSTLSQHLAMIQDLKTSDFTRLSQSLSNRDPGITISTIHKVKGLEFDVVYVPSSITTFPFMDKDDGDNFEGHGNNILDSAAEEARLYYVAVTRAKNELYFDWGPREKAWSKKQAFQGINQQVLRLEGSPDEVFISWPGFKEQYNDGLQDYLRTHVRINDSVVIKNRRQVLHGQRIIGYLQADLYGNDQSQIRVSNIYRYPVSVEITPEKYYKQLAPEIKTQGWHYTVLLAGQL
ncbi:MAG: UvrD-helicase domain-containing protein [Cyanobacteriota bacterium]|nr:UvrD-helicase domain-containing protein [Cyanobacteriota bacterium]